MTTQTTGSISPSRLTVRKAVVVNVPQAHAFAVFTEKLGSWWPLKTHGILKQPQKTAILELRVGGRWFERGEDGSEYDWGRVLLWEPPDRILLAWQLNSEWQFDPDLVMEVEVRFIAEGPRTTRVELEHRNLERLGDVAEKVRESVNSEGGWAAILNEYKEFAHASERPGEVLSGASAQMASPVDR